MPNWGQQLEKDMLNWRFRGTTPSIGTKLWVALSTAAAGQQGQTMSELTGGGYTRVSILSTASKWDAPASSGTGHVIKNTLAVEFPTASGNWETVPYFALWTSSGTTAAAKFIAGSSLSVAKTVETGDTARFAAGALKVKLS
jgi:hypothetical protein